MCWRLSFHVRRKFDVILRRNSKSKRTSGALLSRVSHYIVKCLENRNEYMMIYR